MVALRRTRRENARDVLVPGELFARRYRVVRVLGRGAMGVVYEAVHAELGHRVAIKLLRAGKADDERAVRRFQREARLAAQLTSPHVVEVLDVDRTEDGVPYLVMAFLEGRDLATEVEERERLGHVPIPEVVAWALGICDAMRAAHEAGIVHRDLKLSNVFLTSQGVVKVIDFGVASFHGGDAESSSTVSVAGTPRYMAPEQLLGEAPNPASDVWAVGVLLYRLLTRRFPFEASTMAAQMLAIMDGEKRIEDVAPHVPKGLADVVHRALGKTLEERWSTIAELREALERTQSPTMSEGAVKEEPRGADGNAPASRGVRRRTWSVVAALGVGIVAALVMTSLRSRPAAPATRWPIAISPPIPTATSAETISLSSPAGSAPTTPAPAVSTPTAPAPATSISAPTASAATALSASAAGTSSLRSDVGATRPYSPAPSPPSQRPSPPPAPEGDGFPNHL